MALAQTIICKKRELKSKGFLNELRRNEWVPGVLYGKGRENIPILLAGKELNRNFNTKGSRGIFSLQIEGDATPVMAMVREIQKNALSGELTHVDFINVKMNEKVHVTVTVHISGEEEIIKKGGILQIISREISVVCLPGDIPETIIYDISAINIGDKVTAGDLLLPATVELLEEAETVLANILAPAKEAAESGEVINEEPAAQ